MNGNYTILKRFILGPNIIAAVNPQIPPRVCTTLEPAKSWNPLSLSHPRVLKTQQAITGYIMRTRMNVKAPLTSIRILSDMRPHIMPAIVYAKASSKMNCK